MCWFKFRFRTSCFWEISMLAVATFRIPDGPTYASALTKVTPGSSLIVRTQPSHTQTALMTGRKKSQTIKLDKMNLCYEMIHNMLDKRIVATSDMIKGVSVGSAQVFDFMQANGLSQSWVRIGFTSFGFSILNISPMKLPGELSYCWVYSSVWSVHVSLTGPGSERSLSSRGQAPVKNIKVVPSQQIYVAMQIRDVLCGLTFGKNQ